LPNIFREKERKEDGMGRAFILCGGDEKCIQNVCCDAIGEETTWKA
jgi:hypothetical protein